MCVLVKRFAPLGAVLICLVLCAPLAAQELLTSPGIKTVTPPRAGVVGPRITIQITPDEHVRNSNPPADPAVLPFAPLPDRDQPLASDGPAAWFWDAISPSLPPDPGRFWKALALMAASPQAAELALPRLDTLQGIVSRHGSDILRASLATEVSPALILAVMAVESAGQLAAQSPAGAQGLMQLIPATADRFGVTDVFDPAQNIGGGAAYLAWLLDTFGGDPLLALAGYNAGEGAVRNAGGVPHFPETRDYVPKVLATWMLARALCRTPPELISDGCVFQPMAVN